MGPIEGGSPAFASARRRAWGVAGILMLGLGGLLFAVGLIGLATAGGGAAFIALAIPPAAVGYLVLRRMAAVRVSALSVSLAYGAFALYVATGPFRGLTPADGSGSAGPDLALMLIGAAFGAAAVLLIISEPGT
jgi:hypothetical protein